MIFIGFGVWEEDSTVLWPFSSVLSPFLWYFFLSIVAASAVFLYQCMDIINLNGLILVTAALPFLVHLSGESMTDSLGFLCWGWLWFLVVGGFKHICFGCWRGVSFRGFEFHPSWQWRYYGLRRELTIRITLWKQLSSCWNSVSWLWVLSPLFTLAFHHYATSCFTRFLLSGHPCPAGLTLHTSTSYWTASFLQ